MVTLELLSKTGLHIVGCIQMGEWGGKRERERERGRERDRERQREREREGERERESRVTGYRLCGRGGGRKRRKRSRKRKRRGKRRAGGLWKIVKSTSLVERVGILTPSTPWSLNSLFKAILNSLVSLVSLVNLPQIVGNTPKMTPANFVKKSLNELFIDPGVLPPVGKS